MKALKGSTRQRPMMQLTISFKRRLGIRRAKVGEREATNISDNRTQVSKDAAEGEEEKEAVLDVEEAAATFGNEGDGRSTCFSPGKTVKA